ncbi:venom metalloproteinase 3-like [Phymastichus coffea]|uniref:venom metalloproteinase 3-like n=1 Tax=Phymastichus coffea TaxID=108790 RepID=UPI00273B0881|nr:venom metalloproteinase 3-like [Phymastichus coffea]
MAVKVVFFIICVFGAFFQTQSASITKIQDIEYVRDIRYVQLEANNQEYNLTLVQRIHNTFYEGTPVWTASSYESENDYKIWKVFFKDRQIRGIFYDDHEYMVTVFATYTSEVEEIYYNGLVNIGTKIYKIDSALDVWWQNPYLPEPSDSEESPRSSLALCFPDGKMNYLSRDDVTMRSSENFVINLDPKILVVVDFDLYSELGESIEKVIEYVGTFWNAVDLKFSKLNSPNIQISVTGILIIEDEDVSIINSNPESFNENFAKKVEFVDYDAVFIMTKSSAKTRPNNSPLGSICNRQKSIVSVQDNTNYEGVLSATYELGHLLNLPHDGSDRAERCTIRSGNRVTFMSTGLESSKMLTWSECSRDIIREFAKSEASSCLKNRRRYF